MTPIQALFLKCHPVIHITAKCISETDDYPPEIPGHITKFLEVHIVSIYYKLNHGILMKEQLIFFYRSISTKSFSQTQ